jgi:hypothetical protein
MHEQSALQRILRQGRSRWLSNDTAIVDLRKLFGNDPDPRNITLRFLDPMLVTNAGGLWKEGEKDWRTEAGRRKIRRPSAVHFFDIGDEASKRSLIVKKDLWFRQNDGQCVKNPPNATIEWPLWNM